MEGKYQDAQSRVYWVGTQGDAAVSRLRSGPLGARDSKAQSPASRCCRGADWSPKAAWEPKSSSTPPINQPTILSCAPDRPEPTISSPLLRKARAWHLSIHRCRSRPRSGSPTIPNDLAHARPITSFNHPFTERALPEGKPYRWTTDDGVTVEGMLIYPPGQVGAKHLKLFTLIHGGPADADGNQFAADWYSWAGLAATQGWLVFEPNYRGSIGYGDKFTLGIIPKIVSRPGRDILEGVDALVKDGIADADHLAVGGYSYGGYLTNWLITQTTRFKAAVTGAGAVEHVANWGNDDTTFDDAYFLGGLPWDDETKLR